MKRAFCDTSFFVALVYERDSYHASAVTLADEFEQATLVTTRAVTIETLNFFAELGPHFRRTVSTFLREFENKSNSTVIEITKDVYADGISQYEARLDKGYSITDCISMNTAKQHGIGDILSTDRHFSQAGFNPLMVKTLSRR